MNRYIAGEATFLVRGAFSTGVRELTVRFFYEQLIMSADTHEDDNEETEFVIGEQEL